MGSRAIREACKILVALSVGTVVYLCVEAFQPPERQPSARLCLGMIRAYQSVGSPFVRKCGVRCKYRPTCSHYGAEAISKYGTIRGIGKTLARIWRCSPWCDGRGEDRP